MSILSLESLKASLRVIHDEDDALLQELLDGAEAEACRILNLDGLPEGESLDVMPDVRTAVWLLVSADYEAPTADEAGKRRYAAETKLWPYRVRMGA